MQLCFGFRKNTSRVQCRNNKVLTNRDEPGGLRKRPTEPMARCPDSRLQSLETFNPDPCLLHWTGQHYQIRDFGMRPYYSNRVSGRCLTIYSNQVVAVCLCSFCSKSYTSRTVAADYLNMLPSYARQFPFRSSDEYLGVAD